MGVNKVIYDGEILIDLTSDTVDETKVLSGATFHDKTGTQKTGSVIFRTIYTGTSTPTSDIGSNNDIYIVTGG